MRDILFRGKTKVYNKWVYGWYCGKILNHDMYSTEESSQIIDDKTLYWHTCEPDTVGQFTGLTDKNGKKIFEGDIIKIPDDCDEFSIIAGEVYEVYFAFGGFRLKPKYSKAKGFWLEDDKTVEIIGNIHDNPELLENP